MKVCTHTHTIESFGEIPEGSLWDDESPFITKATRKHFADVLDEAPTKRPKGDT